jgi:hypothetical protein
MGPPGEPIVADGTAALDLLAAGAMPPVALAAVPVVLVAVVGE